MFFKESTIPAIDLSAQSSLNTAFANDVDPDLIYAQQVIGYSSNSKNDVLIAISTSSNSKNVVNAAKAAKAIGIKVIALTGDNDSMISNVASICIKAQLLKVIKYKNYIYRFITIFVLNLKNEFNERRF